MKPSILLAMLFLLNPVCFAQTHTSNPGGDEEPKSIKTKHPKTGHLPVLSPTKYQMFDLSADEFINQFVLRLELCSNRASPELITLKILAPTVTLVEIYDKVDALQKMEKRAQKSEFPDPDARVPSIVHCTFSSDKVRAPLGKLVNDPLFLIYLEIKYPKNDTNAAMIHLFKKSLEDSAHGNKK